jgi:ubiquinone/menaquinone biosynthesis C-methylase UbiE
MSVDQVSTHPYALGHDPRELARLDQQARAIEWATSLILREAGIAPRSRVLDLGTGLGHVARLAGRLVGTAGAVVGIDRSADILAVARQRVATAGETHVTFADGDAVTWRSDAPFDAVVGRLLLFHVADPVLVVRRQLENLRPLGLFVAIDFDVSASRSEPRLGLVDDALAWVMAAFTAAGASPAIGTRLAGILEGADVEDVKSVGIQAYFPSRSPVGPAMLAGIVRSLAGTILDHGIATAAQLDLPTLERRIGQELARADAVLLPPTVVGAWGRRPTRTGTARRS